MSETNYEESFDFMINQLTTFCANMAQAQEQIFRTKPNTPERKKAQLDLDAAKNSLRNSFDGMKAIIKTCEDTWEEREPPERDMGEFWKDFNNQVMSKYIDFALPSSCKRLHEYLDSHN